MTKQQQAKLQKKFGVFLKEFLSKEKLSESKIEEHNFRVNSVGWTKVIDADGNEFLENPEEDIWEIINYENSKLNQEQLFTWDAAMRETKKAGKRMPTDKEWDKILKRNKNNSPNIKYAGYRDTDGTYYLPLQHVGFWSSTEGMEDKAWTRYLHHAYTGVNRSDNSKAYAWSVRCLKD